MSGSIQNPERRNMMEQLSIGTKVTLTIGEKSVVATVTDKKGDVVELTTEEGKTLLMQLQQAAEGGWELVPKTRAIEMTTL